MDLIEKVQHHLLVNNIPMLTPKEIEGVIRIVESEGSSEAIGGTE